MTDAMGTVYEGWEIPSDEAPVDVWERRAHFLAQGESDDYWLQIDQAIMRKQKRESYESD